MQSIHLTAYSPLGSPDSATMMGREDDTPNVLQNDLVLDIAKKLGKEPGQVTSSVIVMLVRQMTWKHKTRECIIALLCAFADWSPDFQWCVVHTLISPASVVGKGLACMKAACLNTALAEQEHAGLQALDVLLHVRMHQSISVCCSISIS